MYAARTSADQRVATAEARLAEEIQRRRDAEAERDAARADYQRLTEQLAQVQAAVAEADPESGDVPTTRPRTTSRTKKTSGTRATSPEA